MSLIIPANSAAASGGFDVANSCRFNPASNDRLTRTPAASGNRNKWTWSGWSKRGTDNQDLFLFGCDEDANNETHLKFALGGDIRFLDKVGGSTNGKINTLAKFRDLSAWYHIVAVFDKDNSTSTDRMIIYVNGIRITDFDGSIMPSNSSILNKTELVEIGALDGSSDMNGYICEVCFIDGQALAPTSFGEFDEDSGIWKPIDVSGLTFGDQGYFLEFKESGTSANSSGIGADTSGNDNHFAVNNLTAIDQSTDTCTTNFATMNSLDNFYAGGTFTEGNLQVVTRDTGYSYNTSTFGVATGKWYWEVKWSAQNTGSTNQVLIGIAKRTVPSTTTWLGSQLYTYGYQGSDGHVKNNNGNATGSSATTYSVGDIISVALDLDNNKIHFAKNGTYTNSSDPAGNSGGVTITAPDSTSGDSGFYFPAFGDGNNNLVETGQFNFGSPPFAISSGNTDGDGYGNFEYAVPSGYFALNTKNLAEYG